MGDGLKYVFEIDGQTPGLDDLLSKLEAAEKVIPKVDQHTRAAGEGHKKHGKDAEHLGGVLQRVTHQAMHPFLTKAKEIAEFEFIRKGVDKLLEFPGEMIEKLKELGEEMISVAAKTERTNKSFELLFGVKGGDEVLEFLEKIAGSTEFTDDRLKGAAQTLATVGFKGKDLSRAISASLDLAALNPNKEEGLSSALFGLEQAKRTGQVSNRTLRPLGLGEDDFLKQLSVRTGEDVKTLKKKMSEGKVAASDSIEALYTLIAQKTGKKLGGAGEDMGKTLEARLTHLKDLPEQFFQKLAKTDAFAKLTDQAGKLLAKLDPESPDGKRIFGSLKNVFESIVDVLESFDIAGLVTGVTEAVETATIMLLELLELIPGETGKKAGFVVNNIKRRRQQNKVDSEERATMATQGTTPEFEEEADYAELDTAAKSGALGAKSKAYAEGKATGEASAEGQADGMKGSRAALEAAGAGAGKAAVDGARGPGGVEAHSPSRKFAEIGKLTTAGFVEGIRSSAGQIDDVLAGAFAMPAPQAGRVAAGGPPIVVTMGDIIVHAAPGDSAQDTAEAVRAIVRSTWIEDLERMRTEGGF